MVSRHASHFNITGVVKNGHLDHKIHKACESGLGRWGGMTAIEKTAIPLPIRDVITACGESQRRWRRRISPTFTAKTPTTTTTRKNSSPIGSAHRLASWKNTGILISRGREREKLARGARGRKCYTYNEWRKRIVRKACQKEAR